MGYIRLCHASSLQMYLIFCMLRMTSKMDLSVVWQLAIVYRRINFYLCPPVAFANANDRTRSDRFGRFVRERALLVRLGGSSTRSSAISDDRAVRQRSPIAYSRLAFATSRPIYHSAGRRRVVTQDGSTPLSDSALEASGKIAQTCRQIFSYSGAESRNGSKADSRPIRFEASR